MRSADVYPSKYLKAEEIDSDLMVTIKRIVLEELESKDGRKQEKPIAYFNELEKGLVLNKTNWSLIAKQHGDESDDWTGKQITLFVMDVEAFGEMVEAIRVKPQRRQAAPVKPVASAPAESGDDATITAYWSEVKKQGLERKQGLEFLNKHKLNFADALAALKSDSEVPF